MADCGVFFDYTADPGERFPSQEVRDEIVFLAPLSDPGSITEGQLADRCVTRPKIGLDAVANENLADQAVDTAQLADKSVTAAKAGLGVMTAVDVNGNPISLRVMLLTATEKASATETPGTLYLVLPDSP